MTMIGRMDNNGPGSAAGLMNDEIDSLMESEDPEVRFFQLMENLSQSEMKKFLEHLKKDVRVPRSMVNNLEKKLMKNQPEGSPAKVPAGYRAGNGEASSRKAEMGVGAMSQQIALNNKLAAKNGPA